MSNQRAHLRRAARHSDAHVPAVPGVVPDLTEASTSVAMEQAHEVLPYMRGTRVTLRFWAPEEGLAFVDEHFGGDRARDYLREKLREVGGSDPHIVIATREPRDRPPDAAEVPL